MSVLIKDMEKPKSCYAVIDGEYEYCPFVNTYDDCVLLLKKGICEETWEMQYSKCPLVEVPEPCEDAVSRRRLLNDLKELITAWKKYPIMEEQIKGIGTAIGYVMAIPPVTPKRKTGKWIHSDFSHEFLHCSECGRGRYFCSNFCPNCGADMRSETE